jgi:hypothetical protein
MKLVSKLLVAAMCAAALVPAMAQEKRSSISLSGTYSKSGDADGNANVTGSYGFMYNPRLELGVFDMLFAGNGFLMNAVGVQAQYYMNPVGKVGAWNPYVKANVGATTTSIDTVDFAGRSTTTTSTGTSLGGTVGIANNLTESTELFFEVGGTQNSSSGTSETGVAANVGLKIRF